MRPPICAPGPLSSTFALPETQTLRCRGVAPIDGEIFAVSPVRVTVTTVPSGRVWEMFPSGSGTKVSALAAPAEANPRATAIVAPTPATLRPRRRPLMTLVFMFSTLEVGSRALRGAGELPSRPGSAEAERLAVQRGLDVVVARHFQDRVGAGLRVTAAALDLELGILVLDRVCPVGLDVPGLHRN